MALKMFTNLLAYRMTDPSKLHSLSTLELNEALSQRRARLPSVTELSTIGFSEVLGIEDEFAEYIAPQTHMIAVNFAERMLPGKVVRQRVAAKVSAIEKEEGRKVYAREKNQIKDAIITEMLPHTFVDQKIIRALLLGPYIIIDSTSAKKGEDVLCRLREVLGSLGVRPVTVRVTPIEAFTRWFTTQELPENFTLTGDFKANNGTDESDFVTGKGTSPESEGLSDLVAEFGRRVTMLGLNWQSPEFCSTVTFNVNEMIGIKGVKWPEEIMDMAASDAGEEADHATLMRATMLLLAHEIRTMLSALLDALGGEEVPEGQELLDQKFAAAFKNVSHINGVPVDRSGLNQGQRAILNDPLQQTDIASTFRSHEEREVDEDEDLI